MPESIPPSSPSSVSVSDMARMVGLSRSRFHQLLQCGVFPKPKQDSETKRPFYDSEGQSSCLQVRQRHVGMNGQRVMFYARPFGVHLAGIKTQSSGAQRSSSARKKKTTPAKDGPTKLDLLVEGLKQLGLANVTKAEASQAMHACFGVADLKASDADVLLQVFRHLSRQNSGDSHRR